MREIITPNNILLVKCIKEVDSVQPVGVVSVRANKYLNVINANAVDQGHNADDFCKSIPYSDVKGNTAMPSDTPTFKQQIGKGDITI